MIKSASLYERVKQHLTEAISVGKYVPGQRLPSENDLVKRLSISRMTVNRALRELSRDGVIRRVKGVGSFVNEPNHHASLMEIRDIRHTIAERGTEHSCRLLEAGARAVSGETADALCVPEGTEILHAVILHFENGAPLQLERRFIRKDFAPGFLEIDFEAISAFDYLQSIAPVSELEHIVEAARPDSLEITTLGIEPDAPAIRVRRRTWVGETVVTLGFFSHPGDRYRVSVRIKPADFPHRHRERDVPIVADRAG